MTDVRKRFLRLRRWVRRAALASLLLLLAAMIFVRWVAGVPTAVLPVEQIAATAEPVDSDRLTIMSINCAHGRSDGWHQLLTSTQTLQKNCRSIGQLLHANAADIAALQECDAPSWWSGNFHQARTIAESAQMAHFVHSRHVDGAGLHYGTALVSRLNVDNANAITFAPTPPTFSKGFTVARMTWLTDPHFHFDVVSVHLDFASAAACRRQILTMIDVLQERGKPVIVAGDFNSDWAAGTAVRQLADALNLSTFQPQADLVTFPPTGGRLDWILVSSEFRIIHFKTLDLHVSDHLPIKVVLKRRVEMAP